MALTDNDRLQMAAIALMKYNILNGGGGDASQSILWGEAICKGAFPSSSTGIYPIIIYGIPTFIE